MQALVLCGDEYHLASVTRDGLLGLGDCGYEFARQENPDDWSAEGMDAYALVIFSKANNRSRTDAAPWADEAIGTAFVNYITQGNGILFLPKMFSKKLAL